MFAIPFAAAIALIVGACTVCLFLLCASHACAVGTVIAAVLLVLLIAYLSKRGTAAKTKKMNDEIKAKLVDEVVPYYNN